jgi:Ulp1 family protease
MLSGNDDFANKRYCGQRGYIILRDLLSKKQRDINLSKSIQHQARIIYNNIYRVYSGRVKIVTTSDENKKLTGSIFCYDGHCNKFQVHVDQLGSESPKVDQYRSNQLIPLDNISHLPKVECCNVDTHQFSLTTNLRSVQQYKYVMTFKHWIYIQLSKCENGRILDREETYDNFTHLVQTSNNIIESYQSEINDATQQVDKHIMTLPFQTVNKTMVMACSGLDYFDRTSDENFNEATILQSIGKYNIVINQSTLNRLRPFSKLNDELVNLAVNWYVFFFIHVSTHCYLFVSKIQCQLCRLTCGIEDVVAFNSFYLNQMQQPGGILHSKIYVHNRNITVTDKKLLIFPYHSPNHWSLFVVVNPNCVISAFKHTTNYKVKKLAPCILLIDSSGSPSKRTANKVVRTLCNWLNYFWKDESMNPYVNSLPYHHRSMPLIIPNVSVQSNGYDCGMHMILNINASLSLLQQRLTNDDITNNYIDAITNNEHFIIKEDSISRARVSFHKLLTNLGIMFNSVRNCEDATIRPNEDDDPGQIDCISMCSELHSEEVNSKDSSWGSSNRKKRSYEVSSM